MLLLPSHAILFRLNGLFGIGVGKEIFKFFILTVKRSLCDTRIVFYSPSFLLLRGDYFKNIYFYLYINF